MTRSTTQPKIDPWADTPGPSRNTTARELRFDHLGGLLSFVVVDSHSGVVSNVLGRLLAVKLTAAAIVVQLGAPGLDCDATKFSTYSLDPLHKVAIAALGDEDDELDEDDPRTEY